jgi:alcohol dehydrogenase
VPDGLSGIEFSILPTPAAHFGTGALRELGPLLAAHDCAAVLIVTDAAMLATPVIGAVRAVLDDERLPHLVFSGVHANPTTDDIAAGAETAAEFAAAGRAVLVAVGGGSSIDAAKGIALAAVNPERGRGLDYHNQFSRPGLPIVAIPTTAGTGAETNAFGVVTDPLTRTRFYVGHASTRPAAAILDPVLTLGLPAPATAATGFDALTHAIESFVSVRANPWADGIALQVISMIAAYLPRACADGTDLEARAHLLLASHMAGIGMATTGLGLAHAIGHAIGGRYDVAHGASLAMVLPQVLGFAATVRRDRLEAIAFALGAGDRAVDAERNATACVGAVADLRDAIRLPASPAAAGIGQADYAGLAATALADEVLANTPRQPAAEDVERILAQPAGRR